MANPLEWYAMDDFWYGNPSLSLELYLSSVRPDVIFYARVVGYPGPVVWTVIWEPMSSGPAPQTWAGGPVSVGQYPTESHSKLPNVYVPQNSDACAIGNNLQYPGIARLSAVAGGVPVPGELVMTMLEDGGSYPDIILDYYAGPPPTEFFWTQHNNTYEIP